MLKRREQHDPSMQPIACEICGKLQPLQECHSLALSYRMPGYNHEQQRGYAAYQCDDEQHFACCHEHAMLAALYCMYEHIHIGNHAAQHCELEHPTLIQIKSTLDALIEHAAAGGHIDMMLLGKDETHA